jgi:acyl-CoA hydrolase
MELKAKRICESAVETREMVIPTDTNLLGNLLGGRLMHLADIAGAMVASRHSSGMVATVCIDRVDFNLPIKLGELILLKARLTWVGRTSMEVLVEVFSENYMTSEIKRTNKAYFTFVALDENGRPRPVPPIIIETEEEKREHAAAEKRRETRLARRKSEISEENG